MVQLSVPANGWLSSPFGRRVHSAYPDHHGIDWGWLEETHDFRVFAAAPGKITHIYFSGEMGWVISILHDDGTVTDYSHLADAGVVSLGDRVSRRQHIGTMGATGYAAFGQRHLHFQYWVNGSRVDPAPYMTGGSGGDPIPIGETEPTMYIAKNRDDSSVSSSRFIWGDGRAPELISESTASLFKDYGIEETVVSRDRWLWLYNWAAARAGTPASGGAVDNGPVLKAVAGVANQINLFSPAPSPAAIAKAVNDNMAQRLAQ